MTACVGFILALLNIGIEAFVDFTWWRKVNYFIIYTETEIKMGTQVSILITTGGLL